jgi:hypothetical protein
LLQGEYTPHGQFLSVRSRTYLGAPTYQASAKSFKIDETESFFLALVVTALPQVQHELIISIPVL